uniref:Shootin-1 n=1 Tax=Chrysolophus pictus TaxID=9089 RepID=A0A8C3LS25_CHRPC
FQKISHMVIEEVNCIQNHLEIEKTCRESAEALASKLNKENKTLKRISMLYMAKLGPEIITEEINIDEDDPSTDTEANSGSCNSVHCQQQIKELRDQIISVHEEKKTLAIELENLRCKLVEVIEEVNKVKEEKAALTTEVNKQQKLLEKCNRVSVLAVEEYEELHVNFELEKNLRKKAESFAQEMFIEQNKMKRQSQLLLQNSAPDQQLLKALDDNAKLTHTLEEERLQHQQKVKELEEQLENQALHKEISRLKQQLELLEEDKKELELKCQNSEEKARDLKHTVDELQKRIHQSENPAPPPPPPPPPPLPPPPPPNPIRSYLECGILFDFGTGEEVTDLKRQAVEEMMDRIKKGVHLRPVNQSSRPKTKPETPKPSESAMKELKGILETLNKSTSSRSLKSLETDSGETELERVLRRRKVTTDQDSGNPTGILATSESKSLPVLGSEASGVQTALKKKDLETEFSSKVSDSGPNHGSHTGLYAVVLGDFCWNEMNAGYYSYTFFDKNCDSRLRFFRGIIKKAVSTVFAQTERDLLSQWIENPRCQFGIKELNLLQKYLFQTDLLEDWLCSSTTLLVKLDCALAWAFSSYLFL